MKKNAITHNLDGLAALLLFAVFAASVMAVLLTGAKAYRGVTRRDQEAYNARTAVQYVAQRVRQADSLYGITLEDFEGVECLVLGQGEPYITRLYCYEGWLMELYCLAEEPMEPQDGQRIMEAEALALLSGSSLADENTVIILETPRNYDAGWMEPYGFAPFRIKTYKTNQHLFIGRIGEANI